MRQKAITATRWSLLATIGGTIIQLCYGVVIARLLAPEDFGLIALSMVTIALSKGLVDSGFYQALIQSRLVSLNQYSAVLKINVAIGLFLCILTNTFSSWGATFFGHPELSTILKCLSSIIIFESLTVVQRASLSRNFKFKEIANIELFAGIVSSIIAVLLALLGIGVYSLVIKLVLQACLVTTLFWLYAPIKINLRARLSTIKKLGQFGTKIFIADQLEIVANQVTTAMIGKQYNPASLGYFTKGRQYQQLLGQTLIIGVNKVVYPVFSKVQGDDIKLKQGYNNVNKVAYFLTFPLMLFGILQGDSIIILLLGENWIDSAQFFKIFCFGGLAYPATVFNLNVIKVKGKGKLYLHLSLLTKGLILPFVFCGLSFGITGAAIALALHQWFMAAVNSYHSGKLVDYHISEQIRDISSYAIASFGSLIVIVLLQLKFEYIPPLLVHGFAYFVLYFAFVRVFFSTDWTFITELGKSFFSKKS